MRKMILIASFTAALAASAAPGLAQAGNACENGKHADKVAGTVFGAIGGAIGGALLGNLVAGHGHKGDGALVGAAGGAIVGNQLARSNAPCPDDGYGYSYGDRRAYSPPPPAYNSYRTREDHARGDGRHDEGERAIPVRYDDRRDSRFDNNGQDYGQDDGRRYDRDGYRDGYGYGRDCRIMVRTHVAPDGDYVTRRERICR